MALLRTVELFEKCLGCGWNLKWKETLVDHGQEDEAPMMNHKFCFALVGGGTLDCAKKPCISKRLELKRVKTASLALEC